MYIMDVPHVRNEDTKLQWRHEVHALAARIEEETGQKITEESLRAAIKLANDKRRALQRLSATRAADPVPISGLDSLLTVQAAFMDDSARLTDAINKMADECEQRVAEGVGAAPKSAKRILYTVANSNAMNGVSENVQIVEVRAWWQTAIIVLDVIFGVLAVGSAVMLVRDIRRKKES